MIDFHIFPDTTDIYSWGINPGNGDRQVEVWTFDTATINITRNTERFTIEVAGIIMDHQFNMNLGERTMFNSAVVMG